MQKALFIVLFLLLAVAPVRAEEAKTGTPDTEVLETGWTKRCPEDQKLKDKIKKSGCEVFQRIDVKKSKLRVAEFAVGFPQVKDLEKGGGLGVVILPLGIYLEQGVTMKIDDEKPFAFKVRTCTMEGCAAYITLKKSLLETMKSARTVAFGFKSAEGQDINVLMSLNGFADALKDVQ